MGWAAPQASPFEPRRRICLAWSMVWYTRTHAPAHTHTCTRTRTCTRMCTRTKRIRWGVDGLSLALAGGPCNALLTPAPRSSNTGFLSQRNSALAFVQRAAC